MANVILLLLALFLIAGGISYSYIHKTPAGKPVTQSSAVKPTQHIVSKTTPTSAINSNSPLTIEAMRQKSYPGSNLTIEQKLSPGPNYNRYVVSYKSEGFTIYGLLTVPTGQKPKGGWPVILFNHGYIPPASYSTISSYSIMVDPLASAGYIVFKPDYRGNGNSEGTATQPYVSPSDVTDSMNALSSIKKYKDADPQKIGVFGHSMGGNVTLHELVITHDIRAAELLAGVVGNESGLAAWWDHRYAVRSIVGNDLDTYYAYEQMIKDNGTLAANPEYWNAIDPTKFLSFVEAPVQIQVGTADEEVPMNFSASLSASLKSAGKTVEYQTYPGANHNLVPDTSVAMQTTVNFFNKYLK